MLAARPPYHASMCSQARPTCTAYQPPGDDETKTVVPSRRHPQSIDAAARHRFSPASPGPTGDAYDRPGTFWARPLCPGAPYPWSILLADTAGCRPGCAPCGRHSPRRWLSAVIDFAQTATPLTGYAHRLPTGLGKPRRIEHQHPIALSQVRFDLAPQLLAQGASSHASHPMKLCSGRRDWPKR